MVAALQEGQGHAAGFLTGTEHSGHACEHLEGAAGGAQRRINQQRLPGGQAHDGLGIERPATKAHGIRRGQRRSRRKATAQGARPASAEQQSRLDSQGDLTARATC